MRKRILILARYDENAIGGQAKFATILGSFLSDRFEIYYLSPPQKAKVSTFIRGVHFFRMLFELLYNIIFNRVELIHVFTACNRSALYEKMIFSIIAKLTFSKVIFNFRDAIDINYKNYLKIEWKIILKFISVFDVLLSQYASQNKFLINEGIESTKLAYIHNGINKDEFLNLSKTQSSEFVDILFIGEVGNRKGVDTIIEAALLMREEIKLEKPFKISIYGPEIYKGYKEKYQKIINESGLDDIVKFYSPILGSDKYERLSQCDVFILPSNSEGFPNSILEAMLYGKPVVTTGVGALEELIQDGVNGFKITVKNSCELKEKLILLINTRELRNNIGAQAKKMILEKYEIKNIVEQYAQLYLKLLET